MNCRHKMILRKCDVSPSKKYTDEELRTAIASSATESDLLEFDTGTPKGRSVMTKVKFDKNEYVIEYKGEVISLTEGNKREKEYGVGHCYMYFIEAGRNSFCVDATSPKFGISRLINHSRKTPNLYAKVIRDKQVDHLCFFAKRLILPYEELSYDYGESRKNVIAVNTWIANS